MRIQVLGPVRAYSELDEQLPIGGPKQRSVLARLAVAPGHAVSSDQLVEAVWGERKPDRALRSLATYVSNLRHRAGLNIEGGSNSYTLQIARSSVDLGILEDIVEAGGPTDLSQHSRAALHDALNLFVGTPFEDVNDHGAFTLEVVRLTELRLTILEKALELDVESGGADAAVPQLEGLVTEHPDREHLRALLMRALYATGRQRDALEVFDIYRRHLQDDLGLDPSPSLRDLELAILQHDDTLVNEPPVAEHAQTRNRLPSRYSTFVGRMKEIDRLRESLKTHRLITVLGPGGIGKSSLAMEAVRGAALPGAGVVSQTALEAIDAGSVASAVAEALGLQPASDVDPAELIVRNMGERPHLLILDGCEVHLTEVVTLVDRVLSGRPEARVVATSREPLMLPGERVIRIDGLPLNDAVELFADRADLDRPLSPSIAKTVSSVCDALDGMALAIELAAARARSIPLEQLQERVDSQMPLLKRPVGDGSRHDSMAQAIQWSTDLLTSSELHAYRWLSVFSTGFRLRDAQGILRTDDADDLVARLVEVSLLQPADEHGEYRYLEPVRQHATSSLRDAEEHVAAHRAHAHWMVESARSAFVDEWSTRRRVMRAWLFRRRGEFLNAVRWASDHDEPDLAISIFAAIGKILWSFEDVGHILEPMMQAFESSAATPSADFAIALADAAYALKAYDRPETARLFVERAEEIVWSLDLTSAEGLRAQGTVMARRAILDCPDVVRESDVDLTATAIHVLEQAGSPNAGAFHVNRGLLLFRLGRYDEAEKAHEVATAWYLTTVGRTSPHTLNHLALDGAQRREEFETGLALAGEAAQTQIDEFDNVGAIGTYYLMAYVAMIGSLSVAEPTERMMRLSRISGGAYPLLAELWYFSELRDADGVMRTAKRWLAIRTRHRVDNEEYINEDMDLTIYGGNETYPRFLAVLLPIVRALEVAGQIEDARYFAQELPSIVDQARVDKWRFDLIEMWSEDRRRLGVGEPEGAPLPEVFERLVRTIEQYELGSSDTDHWPLGSQESVDGQTPPLTFTRIRHI